MSNPLSLAMLHFDAAAQPKVADEMLTSPIRNHYFYGKLLDVLHLDMEQTYGIDKRRLLNRHGLGSGVMCGLGIRLSGDKKRFVIDPGVALDPLGREIIVPQRTMSIDPRQLTDELGIAAGAPLDVAIKVIIGLAYHECDVEPTAALVCDCEDQGCEYGAIRERYAIVVRRATGVSAGDVQSAICDKLFTPDSKSSRGATWERRMLRIDEWSLTCRRDSGVDFVPLALLTVDAAGIIGPPDYRVRIPVVSNVVLLDLILCLASELDQCCGRQAPPQQHVITLEANSRTNQAVIRGERVDVPPSVKVKTDGNPSGGVTVTWSVGVTGGTITDDHGNSGAVVETQTHADGTSTLAAWRTPAQAGIAAATVVATVVGANPVSVTFSAKLEAPRQAVPPVIVAVWPPQKMDIHKAHPDADQQAWLNEPFIDVTFDREMLDADIQRAGSANGWLRAVFAGIEGNTGVDASETGAKFKERRQASISGAAGFTYRFLIDKAAALKFPKALMLVLIRAENDNIRAKDDGTLLDPDFDGGILKPGADPLHPAALNFENVWDISGLTANERKGFAQSAADLLLLGVGGTLAFASSTNHTPGGRYHSFTIIER
ncbi:MAG TPA: hypothetical protein VNC18_15360 [Gemmatimonadaceae bacterium]|jgi:hypothetical protein|nr:hypothetical protein [Gemmatimonadaceae bacterium]